MGSNDFAPCNVCNGRGWVESEKGNGPGQVDCPKCDGRTFVDDLESWQKRQDQLDDAYNREWMRSTFGD